MFDSPGSPDSPPARRSSLAWGLALAAGAASLFLYAWTVSPHAGFDDVAEFQTLSAARGIAHAGYPLYLLCLELFQRLVPGTVAFGANLFSALAGATAVGLVAWLGMQITGRAVAGAATAVVLALSYAHWFNSTHAEIYAFTLTLSLSALACYWAYRRRALAGEASGSAAGIRRTHAPGAGLLLFGTGLLLGAALTSQLGSLALAAVLGGAVALGVMTRRVPMAHGLLFLGGVVLGLTPLALIPLRDTPEHPLHYVRYTFHPAVPGYIPWDPGWSARWERAVHLLSGAQYLEHGWFQPFQDGVLRLRLLGLQLACNDLFGPALVLALAGGVRALFGGTLERLLLLWGGVLLLLLLYASNPVLLADFFLPGVAILALCAGLAVAAVARRSAWVGLLLLLLLVLFPLGRTALSEPPFGLGERTLAARVWQVWPARWSPYRPDPSWERYARQALESLPENAVVLHAWEEGTTFFYAHYALGLRPDVSLFMVGSAAHGDELVREARERGQPLYTTMPPRRHPESAAWEVAGRWERGYLWRAVEPVGRD